MRWFSAKDCDEVAKVYVIDVAPAGLVTIYTDLKVRLWDVGSDNFVCFEILPKRRGRIEREFIDFEKMSVFEAVSRVADMLTPLSHDDSCSFPVLSDIFDLAACMEV